MTFTGPASASYGSTFTVAATSNSGIAAAITATGVCSISGTTLTMTSGTGSCAMTAKWATNNNYLAASATQTTTAAKVAPEGDLHRRPATAPYQSTFTVVATSNSGITPAITAGGVLFDQRSHGYDDEQYWDMHPTASGQRTITIWLLPPHKPRLRRSRLA